MDRFGFFTDRPSFLFLRSITINLVKITLGQIARVFRLSSLSLRSLFSPTSLVLT